MQNQNKPTKILATDIERLNNSCQPKEISLFVNKNRLALASNSTRQRSTSEEALPANHISWMKWRDGLDPKANDANGI